MSSKTITSLEELRAEMAKGCAEAAKVWRNSPELGKPASDMADRLDADAKRWGARS
jgi:hypothetical protein